MRLRVRTRDEQLAGVTDDGPALLERWISDPQVFVHGPIAAVWGHYEFLVDGELSHCGITHMELVKNDGEWKVSHWSFTVETDGCSDD